MEGNCEYTVARWVTYKNGFGQADWMTGFNDTLRIHTIMDYKQIQRYR